MKIHSVRPINEMPGVGTFIRDWEQANASRGEVDFRISRFGNINDEGIDGGLTGRSYLPAQERYADSIEPGIRDLVLQLNRSYGLITYTSCEGHCYDSADLPNSMRHIGILPRSVEEYAAVVGWLRGLVGGFDNPDAQAVPVHVFEDRLRDSGTTEVYDVVELYFFKNCADWSEYFATVDRVYTRFVDAVQGSAGP